MRRRFLGGAALVALVPVLAISQQADNELAERHFGVVINGESVVDIDMESHLDNIDIDDLEVGETRHITTPDGRNVVVARRDNGVQVTMEDKDFTVMTMATGGADATFFHAYGENDDTGERGVVLLPGRDLDATEREALEAALLATGLVDKVTIPAAAAPIVEQHIEIVEFEREL